MRRRPLPDARQVARWIIDDIVFDISDRNGIGNEWHQIDDDIKHEIVILWMKWAEEYIKKYEGKDA